MSLWIPIAVMLVASMTDGSWRELPSIPDKEGFAGAFTGISGGALIVAGGANFPDKKPQEGGSKVWHDRAWVLETSDGPWRTVQPLSRPLGYGVSVTHGGGVVCVGGSDEQRHYSEAFRLTWSKNELVTSDLPPLPTTFANGCGALVGDWLYVMGGQETPQSTEAMSSTWRINLSAGNPRWESLADLPGPGRIFATAASVRGRFWVLGGAELFKGSDGKPARQYLTDAYVLDPNSGWSRIADLPAPVTAAPSPAPTDEDSFYLLGGDDGTQVGVDATKHRGFSKRILRFDLDKGTWHDAGELPSPRVTVTCVIWNERWVIPSGEMRPGIRSPQVWTFEPASQQKAPQP
jgi:N-acetylneuraminate epimerase